MNRPEADLRPSPPKAGNPPQEATASHHLKDSAKVRTTTHAHTGSAVAQKLRTAILVGTLRPGVKLSERALGEELYGIRRVLEPAALRQDAHGDAHPALHDALEQAVDRGLAGRGSHDVAGMAPANQEFHAPVVALARSPRLNTMMAHVQAEMRLVFHVLAGDPDFHAPYSVSNANILAQWKAGHCGEAAAAMDGYLQLAQAQVLAAMPAESAGLP